MKNYLKKLLSARKAKLADLQKRNQASENLDEVRALGNEIAEVQEEVRSLEAQIASLEAEEARAAEDETAEARAGFNPNAALNVVGNATMNNGEARSEVEDPRATMEYRTAFMNYVQRGEVNRDVLQFEQRAATNGVAADLGVLLPQTIIQTIMTELEGVYGHLYSRVRKLNVQGGVKFPIGSFSATFKRITETTTSERQKAGAVTGSVIFAYNIGEIRIARTLLQAVLTVDAFEKEYAKVIVKAYVKAMDMEIVKGDASKNECEGILTEAAKAESRIKNVIEFTDAEISDWAKWEEKLFALIPIAMEGENPEFVMAKQTYVSNLVTMKDKNDQPIKKAGYDVSDRMHKFNEYGVNRVEKDIFKDFNSCANGEYFGMFWVPEEAYGINTNLEFHTKRYFDEETNQYVDKALVINDGKVLNPDYIFLLKKKVQG